jgi:ubiquinone/menaquinone biosynthesis C-methylase UbiE
MIDLSKQLKDNSVVMDMGGGTGWLSAYISRIDKVKQIYIVDTDRFYLNEMLPQMLKLMDGDVRKIRPVEGFFNPIMLPDKSLDAVFICSSIHHADNIEQLMVEIRRVLKDDGIFYILNETPLTSLGYLVQLLKYFVIYFKDAVLKKYKALSPSVFSGGMLYDPQLGDRSYPLWYWKRAIDNAGFVITEDIDTGLATLKGSKGTGLVHFICKINKK